MRPSPLVPVMLAAVLAAAVPATLAARQAPATVHVVATLYGRHATTPAYGHDTLRAAIERIAPDVLVLDVSPTELRMETVAPSKREYPEVIFPYRRARGLPAYAGEPDEPEFTQVVTSLRDALARFAAERAADAQADRAHDQATYAALARLWRTPADVNGPVTDAALAGRRAMQDALAGPGVADAWARWNAHALAVVRRAAAEHPGRRILVLIGVENAGPLRAALRNEPGVRLVE